MNHREIIALWKKPSLLATTIGQEYNTVMQWHYRNSIPSEHWPKIIKAAQDADMGLTYKMLAEANHD